MLGNTGTPSCSSFNGTCLRSPGSLSIMVNGVGRLVWSRRKQRTAEIRVNVNLASLSGPPGFLHGPWIQVSWGRGRERGRYHGC